MIKEGLVKATKEAFLRYLTYRQTFEAEQIQQKLASTSLYV